MLTLVLNAISSAYPDITNRIRASIFLQSDPLAIIASIIDTTAGHTIRTWSFPGLPRNNYGFSLDEIDGGGAVVNNLAYFDVVPGQVDGTLVRDDEQIRVDTTPGLVSGATTATFDGTDGTPDYRGWNIVIDEMTGRDILATGLDYSWDSTTGLFSLLLPGDVFVTGQFYNIHFDSIANPQGNSTPTINDFSIRLITVDDSLTTDDFGNNVIVEPADVYLELQLPAINTIPQGRKVLINTSKLAHIFCVKILPNGADQINFLRGNIYMMPNESLSIYRFTRSGVDEWRVSDCDGNFKTVGQIVADDSVPANCFDKHLLDGESVDTLQYARLYNEIVLNLPLSQVVDYDSWTDSPTYYSLDNSSNPSAAGHFHFPDRRNLFERNNSTGNAGDHQEESIGPHQHFIAKSIVGSVVNNIDATMALLTRRDNGESNAYILSGQVDTPNVGLTSEGTGEENIPQNYLTNKYALI